MMPNPTYPISILTGSPRYQMQTLAFWFAEIPRRFHRRRNDRLRAPDGANANRRMRKGNQRSYIVWSWYWKERVRRTDPELYERLYEVLDFFEVGLADEGCLFCPECACEFNIKIGKEVLG